MLARMRTELGGITLPKLGLSRGQIASPTRFETLASMWRFMNAMRVLGPLQG